MCRRAGSEKARTDHPVVSGLVGCNFASHPSPFCPIRSAGGSDIDNASKPVVLLCGGGRCWVATPRKVKKDLGFTDSASSVPQRRTRTGQGVKDWTGQGTDPDPDHKTLQWLRAQSSMCTQHSSLCGRRVTAPAPSFEVACCVSVAIMYPLYSPMSVEGQYPPSRRLHLPRQAPSAARDHAAPAHLRNCLSPPRLLVWASSFSGAAPKGVWTRRPGACSAAHTGLQMIRFRDRATGLFSSF